VRPRTVILTSVVLSVLASAVTTMLLAPGRAPARQTVSTERLTPSAADMPPAPAAASAPALAERVGRIEARLDAGGIAPAPRSTKEALETLLAITQGERQVAIADSFLELVALGDDVVPEIVALLKSGRDQDWGGGFSISGNMMRGYPRLRTVLIDVLRQIGTPEAHQGLLDGLRGSEDMADYRDVFMLFRAPSDEILVKGMTEMLPAAVRALKAGDPKKAPLVTNGVAWWIHQHEFEGKLDLIEEMARLGFEPARMDRTSFALLVGLSPERAFALTQEMREKQGKQGLWAAAGGLSAGQDVPRAQFVRYAEMLLASGMQENERHILYRYLPSIPCEGIKDPGARSADARILLDFLKRRLAEETAAYVKQILEHTIEQLEAALRQ
jgi:hypothetical protein